MTSTQDLTGPTALVTGSTSGIGQANAATLAQRGAHVLVAAGTPAGCRGRGRDPRGRREGRLRPG